MRDFLYTVGSWYSVMDNLFIFARWENVWLSICILIVVLIHFLIEPARWIIYTKIKNKQQAITFFYIFSATAFFSYIMPAKLGIPIRLWLIKKYQQLKVGVIGLFILVEQTFTMVYWTIASLLLGGNIAIIIILENIERIKKQITPIIIVFVIIIVVALLIVSWFKRSLLIRGGRAVISALSLSQINIIAALYIMDIFSYVVRHFIILLLLGKNDLPFLTVAPIAVISIFAGFISAMPMGLGGYDATIVFFLTKQGMSLKAAILVPVINRAANLLISALIGIPSAYKLGVGLNIKTLMKKVRRSENVG